MATRVYIAWCIHERESLGKFESLCEPKARGEGLHKYFQIRLNSVTLLKGDDTFVGRKGSDDPRKFFEVWISETAFPAF